MQRQQMEENAMYCPMLIKKIIESDKNVELLIESLKKINKHFLNKNIKISVHQTFLCNEIQYLYKNVTKSTDLGKSIYFINKEIIELCLHDLKKTLDLLNSPTFLEEKEELVEEVEELECISSTQKRREIMNHDDRLDLGDLLLQQKQDAEVLDDYEGNTDILGEKETPRNLWKL